MRTRLFFATVALVLSPVVASATSSRTFVSSAGLDTNPCSRPSPCRSFNAALVQTTPGGSIIAIDSAGYGTITIGQSVSIVAPEGVYAGISATSGAAITISGTTATDVVVLRGLSIEGLGMGQTGVQAGRWLQGFLIDLGALHVENCEISGFAVNGVSFATNNAAKCFISNTTMRECSYGFYQSADVGTNSSPLDHCQIVDNFTGVFVQQSIASISNSVIAGNADSGITSQVMGAYVLSVDRCEVVNNGIGITAYGGSNFRVANTTIANNATGISGGAILSRITGDPANPVKTNTLEGNGTAGAFTGTYTAH